MFYNACPQYISYPLTTVDSFKPLKFIDFSEIFFDNKTPKRATLIVKTITRDSVKVVRKFRPPDWSWSCEKTGHHPPQSGSKESRATPGFG